MTVDQLVRHLGQCRRRIKTLRDDNQRLWDSREEWKTKHRERERELQILRKRIHRLEKSRDLWRSRAPKKWTRSSVPPIELSRAEIDRILGMPARD